MSSVQLSRLSPSALPARRGGRLALRRTWPYYLAIAPYFVLFAIFGAYPAIFSFVLAFQKWDGLSDPRWVGLANFQQLVADPTFWLSLQNTVVIWLLSTVPMLIMALVFAALLNAVKRFGTFYRIAYFIPNITSVVAMAVLFSSLFGTHYGVVNGLLNAIGIPSVEWMTTPWAVQVVIAALITWQWTGYNAILYLAGMQTIDESVYEAARLDGAGGVRQFFSITLPLIRPTIVFTLIVSTITGLQSFTEAQVLTSSSSTVNPNSGGPGQAGLTMVLYFYQQGFSHNHYGYASAIAWSVFALVLVGSAINWRLTREKTERAA